MLRASLWKPLSERLTSATTNILIDGDEVSRLIGYSVFTNHAASIKQNFTAD